MNLGIITHRYNNSLSNVHQSVPSTNQLTFYRLRLRAPKKVGPSKIPPTTEYVVCRFALFHPCAWLYSFGLLTG